MERSGKLVFYLDEHEVLEITAYYNSFVSSRGVRDSEFLEYYCDSFEVWLGMTDVTEIVKDDNKLYYTIEDAIKVELENL